MSAPKIVYCCEACARPVAPTEGYIHCDSYQGVDAYRLAVKAWDAAHPGAVVVASEYETHPHRPAWQVHHENCDPRPETSDYWFGVERADTHAKLLDWTAHLLGKDWFPDTDWAGFLHRHGLTDVAA